MLHVILIFIVIINSSIGHDLALMSLCNHTILSHGTFSYWSGYFAGGLVIRPEHFHLYRYAYYYILSAYLAGIWKAKGTIVLYNASCYSFYRNYPRNYSLFQQHPLNKPLPRVYRIGNWHVKFTLNGATKCCDILSFEIMF